MKAGASFRNGKKRFLSLFFSPKKRRKKKSDREKTQSTPSFFVFSTEIDMSRPRELLASTSLAAFVAAKPPSTVVTVSSSDKLDHVRSDSKKSEDFDGFFFPDNSRPSTPHAPLFSLFFLPPLLPAAHRSSASSPPATSSPPPSSSARRRRRRLQRTRAASASSESRTSFERCLASRAFLPLPLLLRRRHRLLPLSTRRCSPPPRPPPARRGCAGPRRGCARRR